MKVRAILNPRAGVAAQRALDALRRGRPSWKNLELRMTERPDDARALAHEAAAAGVDLVLAVGGDGTANEVARGMLGSKTVLGIVPVGSGNGLARALGIPLRPEAALAALETGVPRRMDVGRINGRPFLNVAGTGFDAAVGADFHERGRNGGRRGILSYVRLGLARAWSYEAQNVRLEADGEGIETQAFVVTFANGPQYGGGAVIAPRARLDDGRLDIVVFEGMSLAEVFLNAPRLFLGTIDRSRRYRLYSAAGATLTSAGLIEHHRDGEPEPAADRLEVRLEPRALTVLVPHATAEDPRGPFLHAGV